MIEDRVRRFLTDVDGPLIVALSGGADSTALLMATLRARPGCVRAAHCNFGLRGEESDRDEAFVRNLCRRLGAELLSVRFEVEPAPGQSVEMECRRLRYDWFDSLIKTYGATVLLAHTADDNIETLMLNLLRGAGSHGLAGIPERRDGFARPLLRTSRSEIESYLAERGEAFVVDSTNLESDYRRNFLRNEVLPLLASRWPGMRKALRLTLSNMEADAAFISYATAGASESGCTRLSLSAIPPPPASRTLLHSFIGKIGGTHVHASEISDVLAGGRRAGARWILPGGIVELERDALSIYPLQAPDPEQDWKWVWLSGSPAEIRSAVRALPPALVALPADASAHDYIVRTPKRGDRFRPLGMKGQRLLSDMAKDARMGLTQRQRMRVLERCADGAVIWAEGLRRSSVDLVADGAESFVAAGAADNLDAFLQSHPELMNTETTHKHTGKSIKQ